MIDLKAIREKIERLERDTAITGERSSKVNGEYGERWLDALRRGSLLFINTNMDMEYRFDDFGRIDFTGPENGNQEWRQQLNRFYWLEPIAREYGRSHDEYYALIARKTIEAWMDLHPYPERWPDASQGIVSGDSTLSLSIRVGQLRFSGWWGSVPYLEGSPHFDAAFVGRMYESTMAQLAYLRENMSKIGNWRVSQLDAMCFLGLVLPGADKYLEYALREINEAYHHQINPDGSHTEHNSGYHNWMMEVFTSYALLNGARPGLGLRFDSDRIIRMWDYAIHQYAPDGRELGLNDDGRWYDKMAPADIPEMKAKRDGVIRKLGLDPDDYKLGHTGFYPDAGQYFFRKSWAQDSPMIVYDATNYGGWHCHTARGSIQYFDGKRMLLIDPGSLNYDGGDPFTLAGKQTLLHNTVTVNDMVQMPYGDARVDVACDLPNAAAAVSAYVGGYCDYGSAYFYGRGADGADGARSFAGRHTRAMIWIKDAFIFVADTLTCMTDGYAFRSQWQMDVGKAVLTDGGAYTAYPDGNVFVRAVECGGSLRCRLYEGHENPLLGYVAKSGARLGGGEPAPMLGIEGKCEDGYSAVLAQVIVPFTGAEPPQIKSSYEERGGAMYWDIEIDGAVWRIAANKQVLTSGGQFAQAGEGRAVESDGFIAVTGERAGKPFYAMAVDASYVKLNGETLLSRGCAGDYEVLL